MTTKAAIGTGTSIAHEIALLNNQMTDTFGTDNDLEVTGGGKGWTATTTLDGEEITAKGQSKMGAALALFNLLDDMAGQADEDEAEEVDLDGCSEECQNANPNSPCTCKCGGANHPGSDVVVFGPKPCRCGCGEITKRRYVPGHDARHHFALRAAAAGMDVEAFRAQLKAERNKVAAAKRREKRAAAKAAAEVATA